MPSPHRALNRTAQTCRPSGGICGLAALTVAAIETGPDGWGSPAVLAGFAAAGVFGFAFVVVEHRACLPMLPLGLFSSPMFSSATIVGLFINLGSYGELLAIIIYLQQQRGYAPLLARVALLPQMAMPSSAQPSRDESPLVPAHALPMLVGLGLGAIGLLVLIPINANTPCVWLITSFMAAGLGMSTTMPAATTAVMGAAVPDQAGPHQERSTPAANSAECSESPSSAA